MNKIHFKVSTFAAYCLKQLKAQKSKDFLFVLVRIA